MIRVGLSRRTLVNRMVRQDFAYITALAPAAWYRYNTGITVTGAGVSTWADQSGNGRDLLQGTDTNRPALQADGSILFDGVDNFMATGAFTLNQPFSVYLLFKQISWTSESRIFDGLSAATVARQTTSSPQIGLTTGSNLGNISPALGVYCVIAAVFNGASSVLQLNQAPILTGALDANNAGGFTLGASRGGGVNWSNIQVKEVILFAAAHDATQRGMVVKYLARVGGLSV